MAVSGYQGKRLPQLEAQIGLEEPVVVPAARSSWRVRAIWSAAVLVAIAIGLKLLNGGFPDALTIDAAKPFNAFSDWVIENQLTSALFTDFLTPLSNAINSAFEGMVNVLSRLTWLGLIVAVASFSAVLAGWRLSLLAAIGFAVMGVLGLWDESITTLALVILAIAVVVVVGIPLGIWAGRRSSVDRLLRPVLDAMQTIPAFSYLVPLVLLLGIEVPPAMVATVLFALPPLIRLTSLGIRNVPETAVEVGHAYGSTPRQILRKVQLPLAKPSVMLGVNQAIMMALGMVVIAASVGFGGLGRVVLDGLESLNVGLALTGGLAIVAMAIVLDRVTYGWSKRSQERRGPELVRIFGWHVSRRVAFGLAFAATVLAVVIGRQVLRQQDFPTGWVVSIEDPVNSAVHWITTTFDSLATWVNDSMAAVALNPLEHLLTDLPWWEVVVGVALIAWAVSRRWTLVLLAVLCVTAVGVMGMWEPAMVTLTQVIVAVASAVVLAIPLGVWSAKSDRAQRVLRPILDTMQTMPQFVYLVPVVALLGAGRAAAVVAALVYALPPGIRLTDLGIRHVPHDTVEAAEAYGATSSQTLMKVELPLAKPSIMLGVNQTIMMVLSVVIIGGLVGGGGLGYEVVNGLSHDPGAGMVAGIAILLLAIVIDRITQELGKAPGGGRARTAHAAGLFSPRRVRAAVESESRGVEEPKSEDGKGEG